MSLLGVEVSGSISGTFPFMVFCSQDFIALTIDASSYKICLAASKIV